ncbi:MAG: hypothetical protein JSS95_11720 [Acidobacteria bacterium]|nr:hypothetical protein [Acidobacteriota bacterium]
MNFTRCAAIATFTALPLCCHAQPKACINVMPDYVRSAVEQDNWKILQPQDLAANDLPVWKGNHPGECPGVAVGNFHPKADSSFVIALIKQDEQQHQLERTVIVMLKKNRLQTEDVIPAAPVAALAVVWKLPPGHWRGLYGTKAAIKRDSFVSEQIISAATQYYYDGSRLKSFVISR